MEFIFRASPAILYKFLTTPACLTRWFCDEVDIDGTTYTFMWDGSEEIAELVEDVEDAMVKFHWEENDDEEYLEFAFERSPVTGETILTMKDWADDYDVDDQRQLWESQIKVLRQETGG